VLRYQLKLHVDARDYEVRAWEFSVKYAHFPRRSTDVMQIEDVEWTDSAAGVAGLMAWKVRKSRRARQLQAEFVETALD